MNVNDVKRIVDHVAKQLEIESVSDMTVDQLNVLIAESIYTSITSREYADQIDKMLGNILRRHTRGM